MTLHKAYMKCDEKSTWTNHILSLLYEIFYLTSLYFCVEGETAIFSYRMWWPSEMWKMEKTDNWRSVPKGRTNSKWYTIITLIWLVVKEDIIFCWVVSNRVLFVRYISKKINNIYFIMNETHSLPVWWTQSHLCPKETLLL